MLLAGRPCTDGESRPLAQGSRWQGVLTGARAYFLHTDKAGGMHTTNSLWLVCHTTIWCQVGARPVRHSGCCGRGSTYLEAHCFTGFGGAAPADLHHGSRDLTHNGSCCAACAAVLVTHCSCISICCLQASTIAGLLLLPW